MSDCAYAPINASEGGYPGDWGYPGDGLAQFYGIGKKKINDCKGLETELIGN